MWIETTEGSLANAERLSLISKRLVPAPGSSQSDPDYAELATWRVVAETDRDLYALAENLTELEAAALMERLRSALRHARFLSVATELRHIRALAESGAGKRGAL